MKQSITYDYNQSNLMKMWEVQTQRQNHLKRLDTIYREKNKTRREKSSPSRQQSSFTALHLKNKEIDTFRKLKNIQEKINYENQILRNKLLEASIPNSLRARATQSNYSVDHTQDNQKPKERTVLKSSQKRESHFSESYLRRQQKIKIADENAKIFMKLATVKSDIREKLNIKNHQQKTEQLKQKLQRKSPKRLKMLRTFFQKRNFDNVQNHLLHPLEYYKKVELENEQEVD